MPLGIARLNSLARYVAGEPVIPTRTPKTFTANSGAALSTAQKQFGTASLFLDGSNDNVRSTTTYSDLQLSSGDWTIEGWIRTSDTLSEFLNYQDQGTNNGWAIGTRSSNRLLIVNGNGSTGLSVLLSSNDAWTTNTWTHFAFPMMIVQPHSASMQQAAELPKKEVGPIQMPTQRKPCVLVLEMVSAAGCLMMDLITIQVILMKLESAQM